MTDERFALALEADRDVVLRFCIRLTKHKQRGEDLLQETMFRAWRARESFDGRTTVKNWLLRIAFRLHLDEIRKMKKRVLAHQELDATAQMIADPVRSIESELVAEAGLSELLALTHGDDRQILIWSIVDEMGPLEISELIGRTKSSAKTRQHRALKRLRLALGIRNDTQGEPAGVTS